MNFILNGKLLINQVPWKQLSWWIFREIARDKITRLLVSQRLFVLSKEDHAIAADGKDLTYIYYEIVDSQGNVVPTANNLVRFQLHGQGQLVGVDNGNKPAVNAIRRKQMVLGFVKHLMVKVLPLSNQLEQAGKFTLTAHSDLLKSSQVTVFTGKKEGQEKTVLGTEVARVRTLIGKDPKCRKQ